MVSKHSCTPSFDVGTYSCEISSRDSLPAFSLFNFPTARHTDWILESHYISREIASTDIVYELRDALQPILTLVKKRFGQKWVSLVHIKKDEILIDCLRVFLRLIIFGDIM